MENKQISILDVFLILSKNKKSIILFTTIISIIAVGYSLLTPKYWTSEATFLPVSESSEGLSLGSSGLLGIGASMLGMSQTDGVELITIMLSRTFLEDVVINFNMIEYFELKEKRHSIEVEKAVSLLKSKVVKISMSDESGLIRVSVNTKDPQLSAEVADYFCEKIEKFNMTERMTKGKQQREFLEKRVNEIKDNITRLSEEIKQFQDTNKSISLEVQIGASIDLYAKLMSDKIETEIEYRIAKNLYPTGSPSLEVLQSKLTGIKEEIQKVEGKTDSNDYILAFQNLPILIQQYAMMELDYKTNLAVYEFVYPQYEQARIQEIKDMPTINIVDPAIPASIRSAPKRAFICFISFMLAILSSSLFVLLKAGLDDDALMKISKIRENLRIGK